MNTYSFLAEHIEPESSFNNGQDEDDENEYPISVRIDLSQFEKVIHTNTHYPYIEKVLEPGESSFMFHAKIIDTNFKSPLKPTIQYSRIHPSEEEDSQISN